MQKIRKILRAVSEKTAWPINQRSVPTFRISMPWFSFFTMLPSSEVFLEKGILNICFKFTREHLCRSLISINLLSNFTEIAPQHGCLLVNLVHIFRTSFPKNTSGGLLLNTTASQRLFTCRSRFRRSVPSVNDHLTILNIFRISRLLLFEWLWWYDVESWFIENRKQMTPLPWWHKCCTK